MKLLGGKHEFSRQCQYKSLCRTDFKSVKISTFRARGPLMFAAPVYGGGGGGECGGQRLTTLVFAASGADPRFRAATPKSPKTIVARSTLHLVLLCTPHAWEHTI